MYNPPKIVVIFSPDREGSVYPRRRVDRRGGWVAPGEGLSGRVPRVLVSDYVLVAILVQWPAERGKTFICDRPP